MHTSLRQSPAMAQPSVSSHFCGQDPPQSTSVSEPFLTPSPQLGAWHRLPVHTPVTQSLPPAQPSPTSQASGQDPPQSVSVSVPLRTPSLQVGAWQMLPLHTPLAQSLPVMHPSPSSQSCGQDPPQSTSVSDPFSTLSEQVGARHVRVVTVSHEPLMQSAFSRHASPSGQPAQAGPPQSTSVSSPFSVMSLQPAA